MHSDQQERRIAFYTFGSSTTVLCQVITGKLEMSKLHVRHSQATDRVCMPLAYLAWYAVGSSIFSLRRKSLTARYEN